MIAKSDFIVTEYNGKTRAGFVQNVRTIGERIMFVLTYSETDSDENGYPYARAEYRSLYLDKCSNLRKMSPEEYRETVR